MAGGEGDSVEHLLEDPSELAVYGKVLFYPSSSKHNIADVRDDHSPRQNIDTASLQADIRHQTLPGCLLRDDGSNGRLVSGVRIRRRLSNHSIRSI